MASASAAGARGRRPARRGCRAAGEKPEVPDGRRDLEVLAEPRVREHARRVAAYRRRPSRLEDMVVVEDEPRRLSLTIPPVRGDLSVVLAPAVELWQELEAADRDRKEPDGLPSDV